MILVPLLNPKFAIGHAALARELRFGALRHVRSVRPPHLQPATQPHATPEIRLEAAEP